MIIDSTSSSNDPGIMLTATGSSATGSIVSVAVAVLLVSPLAVTVYENPAAPLKSPVPVTPTVHVPTVQAAGVVTVMLDSAEIVAAVDRSPSGSV